MADYLPQFKPGASVTFKASAAIEGGQAVEVTGDREVGPAAAASTKYVGVAGHSAAAGADVTVHTRGQVQKLKAAGTVAAGDAVQTGAAGTVAAGSTAPIGIALTGGAKDAIIQVLDR